MTAKNTNKNPVMIIGWHLHYETYCMLAMCFKSADHEPTVVMKVRVAVLLFRSAVAEVLE